MRKYKKFIGIKDGEYIIDKKVRRKNGEIMYLYYTASPNMSESSAIKFTEDEKEYLENAGMGIEWICLS